MRKGVFSLLFMALVLFGAAPAEAQPRPGGPSLDRILPQIRNRHPGTFYDAEGPWRGSDGQMRYRLKWMTPDGRIVWFDADARTGRVIGPDRPRREIAPPPPSRDARDPRYFRDDDERFFPDNGRRWNRGNRWPGAFHGIGPRRHRGR